MLKFGIKRALTDEAATFSTHMPQKKSKRSSEMTEAEYNLHDLTVVAAEQPRQSQ